jgi:hypothetical protein
MTTKLHEEHEEVMHYTSASGLHGIVTSKTLWASHTSFLNDIEEVEGFFDRVLPGILKPEVERYFKDVENLSELARAGRLLGEDVILHFLKKIVGKCKDGECRAQDHYVFSFCVTNDPRISNHGLLSQWRGYGLDGGYAIVFDSAGLESLLTEESKLYHEESLMWGNAEYHMSSTTANEQVLDLIRDMRESVSKYLTTGDTKEFNFNSTSQLASFCKHRGFEEENEFRIVVSEPSVEVGPDPENRSGKPCRKAHSYLRDGVSVPCLHLFEDQILKALPIRRVIVGPHPEKVKRKRAVELLLHNHAIEAEVLVSDTPFRGK